MAGFSPVTYSLLNSKMKSIMSGIKRQYFDAETGELVIELLDGSKISRSFKDIKAVEFRDVPSVGDPEKVENHLFVIYSDNSAQDVGKVDASFDISQLITIGSSADDNTECNACIEDCVMFNCASTAMINTPTGHLLFKGFCDVYNFKGQEVLSNLIPDVDLP